MANAYEKRRAVRLARNRERAAADRERKTIHSYFLNDHIEQLIEYAKQHEKELNVPEEKDE